MDLDVILLDINLKKLEPLILGFLGSIDVLKWALSRESLVMEGGSLGSCWFLVTLALCSLWQSLVAWFLCFFAMDQ